MNSSMVNIYKCTQHSTHTCTCRYVELRTCTCIYTYTMYLYLWMLHFNLLIISSCCPFITWCVLTSCCKAARTNMYMYNIQCMCSIHCNIHVLDIHMYFRGTRFIQYIHMYVMRKVRILTILGFRCAKLGLALCAIHVHVYIHPGFHCTKLGLVLLGKKRIWETANHGQVQQVHVVSYAVLAVSLLGRPALTPWAFMERAWAHKDHIHVHVHLVLGEHEYIEKLRRIPVSITQAATHIAMRHKISRPGNHHNIFSLRWHTWP